MTVRAGAWLFAAALSMNATAQETVRIYAAGSLRAPLTAVASAFERTTGTKSTLTFGASGLLRDRIAGGERVDVFASANMEHPESLVAQRWSETVKPFARNELCVLAHSRVPVSGDNVLDVLLDPQWKLGTSTPRADPSGDYAWEVFRRAEAVRPGAYAVLDGKALQLTGGPQSPSPPPDRSVYAHLVTNGDADVFLTYCTNARAAVVEQPTLRSVTLPATLRVGALYGVTARRDASTESLAFVTFLTSPEGQRMLAQYGFTLP